MTHKVKLHVGYIGKTRAGERVEIVAEDKDGDFKGCDGYFRYKNGLSYGVGRLEHEGDIIGPWEEPAAKAGEWIGWNGGECPVHPETVVDTYHLATGEPKLTERFIAGHQNWCNVIAYRIITPYVQPKKAREFWVAERDGKMIEVHCHVSDAVHVREVLDDE